MLRDSGVIMKTWICMREKETVCVLKASTGESVSACIVSGTWQAGKLKKGGSVGTRSTFDRKTISCLICKLMNRKNVSTTYCRCCGNNILIEGFTTMITRWCACARVCNGYSAMARMQASKWMPLKVQRHIKRPRSFMKQDAKRTIVIKLNIIKGKLGVRKGLNVLQKFWQKVRF